MDFHDVGPDRSEPMGWQRQSPVAQSCSILLARTCGLQGNQKPSTRNIPKDTRVNPLYKEMSITFGITQGDSHKEKTSSPRKRSRISSTIKVSILSRIKVCIIYSLQHSRVENNSNLTVGGYLVDTTPVPMARSLLSSCRLLAGASVDCVAHW